MYWDIKDFIKHCFPCQQNKPLNQNPFGLLQPLAVPKKLWEELTTHFITHLPPATLTTRVSTLYVRLTDSLKCHDAILTKLYK